MFFLPLAMYHRMFLENDLELEICNRKGRVFFHQKFFLEPTGILKGFPPPPKETLFTKENSKYFMSFTKVNSKYFIYFTLFTFSKSEVNLLPLVGTSSFASIFKSRHMNNI